MKKTFFQKLENMPVAILPTMVGAATLSNVYLTRALLNIYTE